jgi:hypothetical protein
LQAENDKAYQDKKNLERDLQLMEKYKQKQLFSEGIHNYYHYLENKRSRDKFEFNNGLKLQILEKQKAKDIDKAINKQDLIFLK